MDTIVNTLIAGAIDLHLHATFEGRARRQNMLEVARDAARAGMRALVFKSKDTSTVDCANLVRTFAQCLPSPWRESQSLQAIISMIKEVGPEHGVLATDLGMFNYPPPVEGLRMFIAGLLMGGIEEKHLERMVKINPAFLLNL